MENHDSVWKVYTWTYSKMKTVIVFIIFPYLCSQLLQFFGLLYNGLHFFASFIIHFYSLFEKWIYGNLITSFLLSAPTLFLNLFQTPNAFGWPFVPILLIYHFFCRRTVLSLCRYINVLFLFKLGENYLKILKPIFTFSSSIIREGKKI